MAHEHTFRPVGQKKHTPGPKVFPKSRSSTAKRGWSGPRRCARWASRTRPRRNTAATWLPIPRAGAPPRCASSWARRCWRRATPPTGTGDLICVARYHLAQSVFKQRDRLRSAPLFDVAADACAKAGNEDLWTKSLYQGARAWGQKGDKDLPALQKAAALFEKVWKDHPAHSFADDARLREAEDFEQLKNDARVDELLSGLPDAFPQGDQRGEALWRLAFRAWKKGDLEAARKWLELEHKLLPREDGWWEAGRTLYWLGRVEDKAAHADAAMDRWTEAVREYPLSFYALQA